MKKFISFLVILMALFFVTGTAWSWNETRHVKIAPEGKGDLLIYPFYLAWPNGWENKITVINTSLTHCVVAKIVFRSFKNSDELLDFLIYLSPTDVWTGNVYHNGTTAAIYSTDGSVLVALEPDVFASTSRPMDQPLYKAYCDDDTNTEGYIEIIESTSFIAENSLLDPDTGDSAIIPVSKSYIKQIYDGLSTASFVNQNHQDVDGLPEDTEIGTINALAGYLEFGLPLVYLESEIQATILKDYNNQIKLTTAVESKIGTNALNNLAEIEAALAKDNLAFQYYNTASEVSIHFFTFPTKLTNYDLTGNDECVCDGGDGPYFDEECDVSYIAQGFDLEERTPGGGSPYSGGDCVETDMENEMNWIFVWDFFTDASFTEGWVNYRFTNPVTSDDTVDNSTISYYGAPVIGTMLHFRNVAFEMEAPAWDWGSVSVDGVPVGDYQVTD